MCLIFWKAGDGGRKSKTLITDNLKYKLGDMCRYSHNYFIKKTVNVECFKNIISLKNDY